MKPSFFNVSTTITLIIPLLLIHLISVVESSTLKPATNVDNYIKKCCQVTLYKDICYSSLGSRYSGPADLDGLTLAAIKVSLSEATSLMASMNQTAGTKAVAAVQDCKKLTKTSVGHLRESLDLMIKLTNTYKAAGGAYNENQKSDMRFEMSSVQTWMSAAITNQQTCLEGFTDVKTKGGDAVKSKVCGKVEVVKMLISNALALVNSYVDGFR